MTKASKTKKTAAKPKPTLEIRVGGVRIPVWHNEGGENGSFYKAGEPELSYRDKDGQWHTAKSYGPRDLINLLKAAALAHSELTKLNRIEKSEAEETGETE